MSELMERYEKEKKAELKKKENNSNTIDNIFFFPFSDLIRNFVFGLVIVFGVIIFSGHDIPLEYTGYYSALLKINLFISFGNAAFLYLEFIDEYVIAGVLALLLFHFVY